MEHDYKNYPELTNTQIDEFGFESPHKQITEDFDAYCVKVHDGDTITLRTDFRNFDFPLRFANIDAKELNAGGNEARDWLKDLIEGEEVEIKIDRKNRVEKYGRLLGKVTHRGMDMGDAEMRIGLAVKYGTKLENDVPDANKIFSLKQWL